MKLRRKKQGTQPGRLDEALAAVKPSLAARCEHLRTVQGRTAHLRPPSSSAGVLCGWPGPWVPADPSLQVCRTCAAEAVRLSAGEVA